MDKIYSVEAMVNTDGKNYKGTLDFYYSKCILHSAARVIAEFEYSFKDAEFLTGTTKISFLDLYTKDKKYIQIKAGQHISPMFIVDDDIVDESLQVLKAMQQREIHTEESGSSVQEIEKVEFVKNYNENVMTYFLSNPYRVLGIAANASNVEANEALDKIKRLDRLKVIQSYKTGFQLAGFPSVDRDLAVCQNALASVKNITNKWFWFNSPEACGRWQFESYRNTTLSDINDVSYDVFLARYLYVLAFDCKFEHRNLWHDVFAVYQNIVGEKHVELLREKLNDTESLKINDEQLIEDFSSHIFEPIDKMLEDAGIEAMLSFFRSMRVGRYPALKEYKKNLGGKIAQWVIAREKEIWSKIEEFIGIGELNKAAAETVWNAAQEYDDSIQLVIDNILNALTMEPLRAEMVKSSYKKVMEKVMVLLLAGGRKNEASKYGAYFYKYADNQQKLKILAACGVESIPGAIEDLPELSKLLPQKKEKEMVDGSDFEDITICDASNVLPRVDFCGLDFKYNTIGIRFWISNRTSSVLKFWLMDVEVNDEECCSTEIICEVNSDEYNYYTYELSIPDDIGYYSVNSLSFYVEIDKPGNETIHDTELVRIKCNTITEKLSAEYDE